MMVRWSVENLQTSEQEFEWKAREERKRIQEMKERNQKPGETLTSKKEEEEPDEGCC
jgi:hypothetical protein